jgi:hypothetical protein
MTDNRFYMQVLKGKQCQCERPKKRRHAFCFGCYSRLPRDMRKDLYRPIGNGFAEAYEAAVKYLSD